MVGLSDGRSGRIARANLTVSSCTVNRSRRYRPAVEAPDPVAPACLHQEVGAGPVTLLALEEGTITVEEADREAWRARLRAEANDRRVGGGIRARLTLMLVPAAGGTRVLIDTDLAVLGRIGEFGQPIIRKKADALLGEFAQNLRSALAA